MLLTTHWWAVPRGAPVLERLGVREHGFAFWVALWAAAVAAELLALIPVFEGDVTGPDVVYILAAGSFAACGLVAWRRRPDNLSRPADDRDRLRRVRLPAAEPARRAARADRSAVLLSGVWTIGYVALLLTFMTGGRLESAVDLVLVGVVRARAAGAPVRRTCCSSRFEGNLLVVEADAQVAEAIDDARLWLTAATTLAIVVVIALRWRAASRPRRKALLPGVVGIVSGLLYIVQLLVGSCWPRSRCRSCRSGSRASRCCSSRRPTSSGCCARGWRAAGSRSCSSAWGRCAARSCRRRSAARSAIRASRSSTAAPRRADGRSVAPIERGGEAVAALVYDASLDDDPELVDAVAAAAAIALENERLHEESQARLAELRASRQRLVAARRRGAAAARAQPARRRTAAARGGRAAAEADPEPDPPRPGDGRAAGRTRPPPSWRCRSRSCASSRAGSIPAVLDKGLAPALARARGALARRGRRLLRRARAAAAAGRARRLLRRVRGARERREVRAGDGRRRARARRAATAWTIAIADDGVGGASPHGGSGLRGLADRVEALGGRLRRRQPGRRRDGRHGRAAVRLLSRRPLAREQRVDASSVHSPLTYSFSTRCASRRMPSRSSTRADARVAGVEAAVDAVQPELLERDPQQRARRLGRVAVAVLGGIEDEADLALAVLAVDPGQRDAAGERAGLAHEARRRRPRRPRRSSAHPLDLAREHALELLARAHAPVEVARHVGMRVDRDEARRCRRGSNGRSRSRSVSIGNSGAPHRGDRSR